MPHANRPKRGHENVGPIHLQTRAQATENGLQTFFDGRRLSDARPHQNSFLRPLSANFQIISCGSILFSNREAIMSVIDICQILIMSVIDFCQILIMSVIDFCQILIMAIIDFCRILIMSVIDFCQKTITSFAV
jgi:hypothetical protein